MKEIAAQFEISGRFADAAPYGSGHIHDTYLLRFEDAPRETRYILQRINTSVFLDAEALMDNVSRICGHQRRELERECAPDPDRRHLRLVPTIEGRTHWVDADGDHWRCFFFQEHTRSLDQVESERQAFESARAFGDFGARMTRFEGPPLAITIPNFHDLDARYAALEAAVRTDSQARARTADAEIQHAASRYAALKDAIRELGAADLPIRIVHNDCKVNNVLIDAETGEGLCAIDLDTVMDGTVLADFGELVRTSSSASAEDAKGLGEMSIELDFVRGVARGYLAGMGAYLTDGELNALPIAGSLMALENAVRFLSDHLSGDVYFRIHRADQNLDRARVQLRRVELLEAKRDAIRSIVEAANAELRAARN